MPILDPSRTPAQLCIRISPVVKRELDRFSKASGLKQYKIVEMALEDWLESQRQGPDRGTQ